MRDESKQSHFSLHHVGLSFGARYRNSRKGATQRFSASTDLFFLSNSSHFSANGPSSKPGKSPASFLTTRIMQLVTEFEKRWVQHDAQLAYVRLSIDLISSRVRPLNRSESARSQKCASLYISSRTFSLSDASAGREYVPLYIQSAQTAVSFSVTFNSK